MSLDKLSDDLLMEIAEWVGTDGYPPPLANTIAVRVTRFLGPLALCSRRLNAIVSPLLYRTFTQTNKEALPAFLHLVLEKPQIGELVKKLVGTEISSYSEDGHNNRLDMSRFSVLDFDRCGIAMDSFDDLKIDKPKWMADVKQGNWYAIVALLLLCLPNLEEIEMAWFYGRGRESIYIIQTFNYVASNQSFGNSPYSLKRLKPISAALDGIFGYRINLDVVLSLLAPPSVSKIVISGFNLEGLLFEPRRLCHVQDLRFNDSCVDGDIMIKFLCCFPSVRKFHYVHGDRSVGYHLFLPQKMGEALAHLHHCLEGLTLLGDKPDERFKQFDPKFRQGIGSLTQFNKLRQIKMCVEDLLRRVPRDEDDKDGRFRRVKKPKLADIFPASLQTLVLCRAVNNILVLLYEFLNDKESFPLLTNIVVGISGLRDYCREEDLKSEYKDAGIQLHMIHPGDPAGGMAALLEDG
jgi:hypothetical protein